MATGKIGVTTENIFPVIKKFLYSDHEIFLRELVSNAVDATQKLKTLASIGEFKGELGDLKVTVTIDKDAGTIIVSDNGLGMDAEDVEKYINQIAFSGAEEFLAKYKDAANSIIGHFGLGFYSAFMVSKRVEISSLSYKENAKPIIWSCDGSPEYSMSEGERKERGTDIILYIDDDNKEFLEQSRIDALLKKYCRFLPVKVISGKVQEWKDGKYVDTDKDNIVNTTEPLWSKKPSTLTDEDYIKFYHELIPGNEDPMFWIHLNVDFPFTLTGILYFPKIKNNFDLQKNRIQLYCNQVFVTDQVEGVVPEFMTIMQGVIDSPDIPLNVSRSYLQADTQVKKISSYISKKVAERLDKMFKSNRKDFEEKWDDIKIFIEYGMLTDEKFCSSSLKYSLFKTVEDEYFTFDEYKTLVESNQTDKDGNIIYLYATDKEEQYSYINSAKSKGYSVLIMDGQLDNHYIGLLEQKLEKTRFVRVDSDIVENLIVKEEKKTLSLDDIEKDTMTEIFKLSIPKIEKAEFLVQFEALTENDAPATIIQNEFMRRMKDMASMQAGMSFYGEMPDSYSVVVNLSHPAVKNVKDEAMLSLKTILAPMHDEINKLNSEIEELRKKSDEVAAVETTEKENKVSNLRNQISSAINEFISKQIRVRQIIDLALLQANLLKGENLNNFIVRSAQLL